MAAIVAGSCASVAILSTVLIAYLPDAHALVLPLVEPGNEYAMGAVSILASLLMLAVLSVLALSGRE